MNYVEKWAILNKCIDKMNGTHTFNLATNAKQQHANCIFYVDDALAPSLCEDGKSKL